MYLFYTQMVVKKLLHLGGPTLKEKNLHWNKTSQLATLLVCVNKKNFKVIRKHILLVYFLVFFCCEVLFQIKISMVYFIVKNVLHYRNSKQHMLSKLRHPFYVIILGLIKFSYTLKVHHLSHSQARLGTKYKNYWIECLAS